MQVGDHCVDAVPRQGLGCPEIWWRSGRVAQGCVVGIWSARKHHLAPCAFFRAALAMLRWSLPPFLSATLSCWPPLVWPGRRA